MTKARDIASAIPAPSTVSSAELGFLDGVTSAIQTQVDAKTAKSTLTTTGDIYYASAANTPARLAIGSTSNVLTVAGGIPSWAAPAGGGGMTSIASGSLSGTSLSLTSISGSYKNLVLILNNVQTTSNENIAFRINNNTSSVYDTVGINSTSTTFAGIAGQNATSASITYFAMSASDGLAAQITFIDYTKTTTRKLIQEQSGYTRNGAGQENNAHFYSVRDSAAITRIDVFTGGNNFSAGTYILYGVN